MGQSTPLQLLEISITLVVVINITGVTTSTGGFVGNVTGPNIAGGATTGAGGYRTASGFIIGPGPNTITVGSIVKSWWFCRRSGALPLVHPLLASMVVVLVVDGVNSGIGRAIVLGEVVVATDLHMVKQVVLVTNIPTTPPQ